MTSPRPGVGALLVSLSLSSLGLGISLPIVALYALELGAGPVLVGVVVALRWVSRLVTDIPAGVLSERIGRRRLYVVGISLVGVSGVLSALAPDVGWLALARIFEGVGAGMSATVSLALIADLSRGGNRGRMLGHYQTAHRFGLWFGPPIGGVIAVAVDLRSAIWVYAALALVAVLPALLVRDGGVAARAGEPARVRETLGALFRSRDVVLISGIGFAIFFTMSGTQFTVLPLLATGELQLGADTVGWALFASNTVGFLLLYPTGVLSDRGFRREVVVALAVAAGAGLLVMAVADDLTALFVAALLLGGGNALRGPATQAYAMDAGGAGSHGATAGVFRAVGDAGSTAGPIVAGLLLALGPRSFLVLNAVIVLVAAAAFLRWASRRPGTADATGSVPGAAIVAP